MTGDSTSARSLISAWSGSAPPPEQHDEHDIETERYCYFDMLHILS